MPAGWGTMLGRRAGGDEVKPTAAGQGNGRRLLDSMGYPDAVSAAHEQAAISGHDREEFHRMILMLLEQRGLPAPESAKSTARRRPWV